MTTYHDLRVGGGTFKYTLADNTKDDPRPPLLSTLSPTAATSGSRMTIQGSRLRRTTRLFFGTSEAQVFHVDSDSQITAIVPQNPSGATVSVTAVNPYGVSNALSFRYN